MRRAITTLALIGIGAFGCFAQIDQPALQISQRQVGKTPLPEGQVTADNVGPTYALGPNDQVTIRAFGVDEINDKSFRVGPDGNLSIPLIGTVRATGLTVQELEAELTTRLKTYVRAPQLTVNVTQFRSEPVFFVGAFKAPGIYSLQGHRTLLEMLTVAGGLQPNTSRRIKITRRLEFGLIPLPGVVEDRAKGTSSAEISLSSLRENISPAEDIELKPFDTITVDLAELVYVNGDVNKVGAFELGERDSLSTIQLLSMAGGTGKDANLEKSWVLRPTPGSTQRTPLPINLKRIMAGKAADFPLLPNDVLYVPQRSGSVVLRGLGPVALTLFPALIYLGVR